ncbi:hypothetical protein [Clostridium sp. HMP27]|uniref:hypothetical protein n=1 Tax=Clostridium sp. HMP27 TaxID=1487921 RepID=UPI00052B5350|nr:hypothetical protein [Clostridium sp. HMP27]KGK88038.1 hypothetical protein DP68_08910 [Clostridium sp. HMP27]
MLDQERGSIIKFFQTVNPVKIYIEKVPEEFIIPSMYFPVPFLDTSRDSLSTYQNDYQMFVKIFEETTLKASTTGEKILEELSKKRNIIKVYTPEGLATDQAFRIDKINGRGISDGVYQIEINWRSRRELGKEESKKVKKINLNMKLGGIQ